jgi:protein ImuB
VRLLRGPERIESGWWDRCDAARDYYIARREDGAWLWVYRDLVTHAWYLQGLWT